GAIGDGPRDSGWSRAAGSHLRERLAIVVRLVNAVVGAEDQARRVNGIDRERGVKREDALTAGHNRSQVGCAVDQEPRHGHRAGRAVIVDRVVLKVAELLLARVSDRRETAGIAYADQAAVVLRHLPPDE